MEKRPAPSGLLLNSAAFVVVTAGMKAASSILIPFLLSAFIAIISAPLLLWLRNRKVPTGLAILIVILGVMAVGVGIAAMVGTSIDDFTLALPAYQASLKQKTGLIVDWLDRLGIRVSRLGLEEAFDPGAAMKLTAKTLSGLGGALTNSFLILLTVIFILLEASGFPAKLEAAFGSSGHSLKNLDSIKSNVQRYMAIKTVISLGTGAAVALWLAVIGVDYPLLWGLLTFLLNYVPNIGSIIAALPAVLLAIVQGGASLAGLALLGYVVINVGAGNVIEPRVMGRGLGLSTLVVFLSLVFWGWVFGPVGMLLSVPLTMVLKIGLDSFQETRWISILLGSEKPALAAAGAAGENSISESEDETAGS